MKHLFIRSQILLTSILLFLTFAMMQVLVTKNNARWDATREKIYSLSEETLKLLGELSAEPLEVLAFFPHDDPGREAFEIFLKECAGHHPHFKYLFYDPDRVPRLTRQLHVEELYTVLVRYAGRQERVIRPNEETFASALLRLAHPRKTELCFVTGHGEASLPREDRNGLKHFRQAVEDHNYVVHEILLTREKLPPGCQVLVEAGPHENLDLSEWNLLREAFQEGRGIFFLVDPMDPGQGQSFVSFMREYGVVLGENVVVDKMSRMVGGDFLVPLVSQYVTGHPVTEGFDRAAFLPVARSVNPATDLREGLEVVPLALSSSDSWAETDLLALEKGQADFTPAADLAGPISLMAAVEGQPPHPALSPNGGEGKGEGVGGRMVVVGDSDFITNAYLDIAGDKGNRDLALRMIQWLAREDRMLAIPPRHPEFRPLLLTRTQRLALAGAAILLIPLGVLAAGGVRVYLRKL